MAAEVGTTIAARAHACATKSRVLLKSACHRSRREVARRDPSVSRLAPERCRSSRPPARVPPPPLSVGYHACQLRNTLAERMDAIKVTVRYVAQGRVLGGGGGAGGGGGRLGGGGAESAPTRARLVCVDIQHEERAAPAADCGGVCGGRRNGRASERGPREVLRRPRRPKRPTRLAGPFPPHLLPRFCAVLTFSLSVYVALTYIPV